MTDLRMLGFYILIAMVTKLIFGRSLIFRHFLGARDLKDKPARQTVEERFVDAIAKSGSVRPTNKLHSRMAFRSTWGFRLVGLALSSCVLFMLCQSILADMLAGRANVNAYWIMLPTAVWGYYNFYIFTYEVILFDGKLINNGYFLNKRRFDLQKLQNIEQDASGFYRLQFAGGRTTHVLKYVQEHETLYKALSDAVEQETYTLCPSFPR